MINDYLAYILLAVTIVAIPGPAVFLTIKNSVKHGFRISVAGISGNFIAMVIMATISAFGLGAIIVTSSSLFATVKTIGCLYLLYLGVRTWKSPLQPTNEPPMAPYPKNKEFFSAFREGILVGLSNPKAIVFFTALFPQFIDPARSFLPQFSVLILTIEGISFLVLASYALISLKAANYLCRGKPMKVFQKFTGGAFIGFGVALLYE